MLKREFDQMQSERKEFQIKFNNIISNIQEEKKDLNNLLDRKGHE